MFKQKSAPTSDFYFGGGGSGDAPAIFIKQVDIAANDSAITLTATGIGAKADAETGSLNKKTVAIGIPTIDDKENPFSWEADISSTIIKNKPTLSSQTSFFTLSDKKSTNFLQFASAFERKNGDASQLPQVSYSAVVVASKPESLRLVAQTRPFLNALTGEAGYAVTWATDSGVTNCELECLLCTLKYINSKDCVSSCNCNGNSVTSNYKQLIGKLYITAKNIAEKTYAAALTANATISKAESELGTSVNKSIAPNVSVTDEMGQQTTWTAGINTTTRRGPSEEREFKAFTMRDESSGTSHIWSAAFKKSGGTPSVANSLIINSNTPALLNKVVTTTFYPKTQATPETYEVEFNERSPATADLGPILPSRVYIKKTDLILNSYAVNPTATGVASKAKSDTGDIVQKTVLSAVSLYDSEGKILRAKADIIVTNTKEGQFKKESWNTIIYNFDGEYINFGARVDGKNLDDVSIGTVISSHDPSLLGRSVETSVKGDLVVIQADACSFFNLPECIGVKPVN